MKTETRTFAPANLNAHNMGSGQKIRHAISGASYRLHYKMRNGWMTKEGFHLSDQSLSHEPWEIECDRGTLINTGN